MSKADRTREAIAKLEGKVAELKKERDAVLLSSDGTSEIAQIDDRMHKLKRDLAIQTDRLALLEREAQREAEAAAVKRSADLIDRFAKTLASADELAVEVQDKILPDLLAKVRLIIELRERARAGFAVTSSHAKGAAESIEGAAMSAQAVMAHLSYEFYRTSTVPFLGGTPGEKVKPSLPGALCPRIEWRLLPDRITPFAAAMKQASAFAVRTLKEEIGNAAVEPPAAQSEAPATPQPVPQPTPQPEPTAAAPTRAPTSAPTPTPARERPRSDAEVLLAQLLDKQNKLSEDITEEGEAAYRAVCDEIAKVSALIMEENHA